MINKVANPIPQSSKGEIKILNERQILLENTQLKVHDLKRFMRKHKETIEEIVIKNCATSQKRFETIHILFLETDLLLIDFTNLIKLEVDNLLAQKEERDQNYSSQMDNLYQHSLQSLMAEFNIHQMLRQNLNSDKSKIVIKQLSFDSKNAFYYSLNALLKYKMQLKCVSFVNILDMKINPMKAFFEKMRDLALLTEIQFINVLFSDQNILQIRYLLNWKQKELERLVFKRIQMSEYQLQMLFIANNFSLSDLTSLKQFIFKCDDKLQKCTVYKNLLKKYDSYLKKKAKHIAKDQQIDNQIQNSSIQQKEIKKKHYIKQKLFEPKHIIIHNQLKISQFSSFQKELQQPLKILLFQLSQSNFCQELDISAISLIGAPQEIITYLIKSVCDSLSLHTLKIQSCQELISLLLSEFRSKNDFSNNEDTAIISKKQIRNIKKSQKEKSSQFGRRKSRLGSQQEKKGIKIIKSEQNENEINSGQIKSDQQLSHRQLEEEQPSNSVTTSANFIKVKHIVKRKALKKFTVEGSDHNIFGQNSLSNIIQMMQFSETVTLDFKDSVLTKDGIKGLLDGLYHLSNQEDDLEVKNFNMKNMNLSSQIDGQTWMKFGTNLFTTIGQFLESISFDQIKVKESVFLEIMRGIISFKVKQMNIQIKKFTIFKKSDVQMQIDQFLNTILAHLPLTELRISSQVDSNLFKINSNHTHIMNTNNNSNNNNNNLMNKIYTQTLPSHQLKSRQMSMSQCAPNEAVQSLGYMPRNDINLIPCSTIRILQLNHFKQINWSMLIKCIVQNYIQLEELDISENSLSLDFVSSLIFNSGLQNLKFLKKLNLSKNPLKTVVQNAKLNYLQNSQVSIISGILVESSSQKHINIKGQQINRQKSLSKQKIKLFNSTELNYIHYISNQKMAGVEEISSAFDVEEVEGEGGEREVEQEEENHKQCDDSQQQHQKIENSITHLDISKNLIPERKKQMSITEERNTPKFKDMKIKKSDDNYAKRVMNDFFTFIFGMEALQELNLSSTQMSNVEVDIIENQMQNPKNKTSQLNFETINLSQNQEIRQTELFKKKMNIFQDSIDKSNQVNQQLAVVTSPSKENMNLNIPVAVPLKNLSQITELNLSKWDINVDFTKKLTQILNIKQCQFKTINLSENSNISFNQWYEIIVQIFSEQGRYLENLYLCNCKFEDRHILEICRAIKYVCKTKKEDILQNYEYGTLQLNVIDLSHNPKIEKEGWFQIIKTFFGSVLISIRSICLRSCSINNIKAQYLQDGLKEANLELRKSSDICLRCIEQIDLRDNPIPLSLQIDLQKNFLLSNILQSQMSQIQECKPEIINKLQEIDLNRDHFIGQIQKKQQFSEKPSAEHICLGIESANYMDVILPNVLKQFSYIDNLVIHIDFQYLEKLTQGLDDLEQEYKQKEAEELFELQFSQQNEEEQKQQKQAIQKVQFRSVTLILDQTQNRPDANSFIDLDHAQQKRSKFNTQKFKSSSRKKLKFDTKDNFSDGDSENQDNNKDVIGSFNQFNRIENENKSDQEDGEEDENGVDLVFNYEKYKQMKKKQTKANQQLQQEEEDEYELTEKERGQKQIDPQIWESILTSLYNVSKFEELIMKNCNLDGRSLVHIGKLESLKSIDISDNQHIYLVPNDKNNNSSLKDNPFQGFATLFQFQKIQELNLSSTQINSRFVQQFVQVILPKNKERRDTLLSLQTINLSNTTQMSIKDWQLLIKTLINNTILSNLILRNCQIGKHNIQGLVNALLYAVNTEYLSSIDLSENTSIYPEDWGIIIVNLFNRYQIRNLNVSYCAIYDEKLQSILKNLFPNRMEFLEVIDFSGNQIESPEHLFKFMNLLYQATNIKEIKFENCNLNKKNTEYFNDQVHLLQIRTLKTQSSLQMVNFSHNPMILESYCHSYTYFQTFLENSTQYFQCIQEINLENCLTDQTKINSFIQCFISINSKGLKVRSLLTLNISGNRIIGEQFSEMLPLIAHVATSLQNLYIGNNSVKNKQSQNHKPQSQPQENAEQIDQNNNIKPIKNAVQGITRALQKIQSLQLQKIQVSDEEEISADDWQDFLENLFSKVGQTLQHIRIDGQRNMSVKESTFFSSIHKLLRQKKYSNHFIKEQHLNTRSDKIELKIQSIGYCQKTNPKVNYVLTGFSWQSFIKNGFQPEVESGHILLLENDEYEKHFWKVLPTQKSVYIKLHNDMSIMKFEDTVQNDNFQQNLKLKADLYIALNYLRQFLNCEQQVYKSDSFTLRNKESSTKLFLKFNYNYSKLPIFNIPDVLKAPFQFREADLTPILKGYENLTFDYPLYIFFIQTCNLYPCDSIADFFVKFIKSLSSYYFSIDQGIFNMIQASPHFFLTEKDRDNIQKSMNKYKNQQEEDHQIVKQVQKKIPIIQISNQSSKYNNQLSQHGILQNQSVHTNLSTLKKNQSNRHQTYLQNSIQLNSNRLPELANNESTLQQTYPQQGNANLNMSKILNIPLNNQSSNQIQNENPSQINRTQIINEQSQIQLFLNKYTPERQAMRHQSQLNAFNLTNQSFHLDQKQNIQKQALLKKQQNKSHLQKLEKKVWTVLCPYYFSSETMNGMEEIQIIHRIQKMPPSELELKGMSISAIKTIYAFCFQNPYFTACQMDYHPSVFVNTSLAWSLREKIYKNYCNSNRNSFKNKLQKMIFGTLRLMIRENVFYKYDNSAIMLDQYYQNKNITHHFLMVLIIIYHFLTSMVPFLFSDRYGVTKDSHGIYAAFSFITFVVEYRLIKDILGKILHLTPGIYISGMSTTLMQRCYNSFKLALINQTFINYKYLIYLWYLICSQFSRFNTYSDFCFLVLCLKNNSMTIFYLSCLILFINKGISIYRFINIILKDEINRQLPGYNITKFYETSIQLEFIAYSEVLDIISPYNVTRIPNNWITKLFIPQISGQSMNQRIYYQLLKILFEDLPQIILQITYLIGQIDILVNIFQFSLITNYLIFILLLTFLTTIFFYLSYQAYISLIMSFISFSLAFYKILSIRPSIISQLDFDELKIQKQGDHLMVLKQFEKSESKMFEQIYNQFKTSLTQSNSPNKLPLLKNPPSPLKLLQSAQNSNNNNNTTNINN